MNDLIKIIESDFPFKNLEGIHGKEHARRVLLLAKKITELVKQDVDYDAIIISALMHDVGRIHDDIDSSHGARSAELIGDFVKKHDIDCNIRLIKEIATRHSLHNPPNAQIECLIVGDADKLDRFRLGYSDLRVEYLELKESLELVEFAAKLNGF